MPKVKRCNICNCLFLCKYNNSGSSSCIDNNVSNCLCDEHTQMSKSAKLDLCGKIVVIKRGNK